MFERLKEFLARVWAAVVGVWRALVTWLFAPFVRGGSWIYGRRWWIKGPLIAFIVLLIVFYGYFFVQTQRWTGFDPNYPAQLSFMAAPADTAQTEPVGSDDGVLRTCTRSGIAEASAAAHRFQRQPERLDFVHAALQAGLFSAFPGTTRPSSTTRLPSKRGVNQAVRRTTVELVDSLGRVRGTSQVDQALQEARGAMQFDEYTWYFRHRPVRPQDANTELLPRRDAKPEHLQRKAGILARRCSTPGLTISSSSSTASPTTFGSTSAILRERSENFNSGWFDTRADDRFWFAFGQLYGYHGILLGARHDFQEGHRQRAAWRPCGRRWKTR